MTSKSLRLNGSDALVLPNQGGGQWFTVHNAQPISLNSMGVGITQTGSGQIDLQIFGVRVDGQILLEFGQGVYPRGQVSTAVNNSALLSREAGTWTTGIAMKANANFQAAWLVQKRLKA